MFIRAGVVTLFVLGFALMVSAQDFSSPESPDLRNTTILRHLECSACKLTVVQLLERLTPLLAKAPVNPKTGKRTITEMYADDHVFESHCDEHATEGVFPVQDPETGLWAFQKASSGMMENKVAGKLYASCNRALDADLEMIRLANEGNFDKDVEALRICSTAPVNLCVPSNAEKEEL